VCFMDNAKTISEAKEVKVIIFSKDRALQLDGVLRSLLLHCHGLEIARLNVLYLATNEIHIQQYRDLMQTYPMVNFYAEKNFRMDLLSMLDPFSKGSNAEKTYLRLCGIGQLGFSVGSLFDRIWRRSFEYIQRSLVRSWMPSLCTNEYVVFLVDDNIFTKSFSLGSAIRVLEERRDLLGFSLRLGENVTYCYVKDMQQDLPVFTLADEGILLFDWTKSELDFGYPLEISSSIYRLVDILPFVAGLPFATPNELEDRMAFRAKTFQATHPYLGCYRRSVTFCNPVNKVQKVISNRSGGNIHYGIDELADCFERGERIRVKAYADFVPSACHQEVELFFERFREK